MTLLEKPSIQLWNVDLDKFLEEWEVSKPTISWHRLLTLLQRSLKEWEEKATMAAGGGKNKRKQKSLRKSLGAAADSDGSEDDFKPAKLAAKARKPPQSKLAKPVKPKHEENEGDIDKTVAAPKRIPAPKKPIKLESDSESDAEVVAKPPARKAPAKTVNSDSDSDVKMTTAAPNKGKGKAKETVTQKRKR
jgi:DNA topoisomerase-2